MADIQLTDDLGKSVQDVKIDLSLPSSLLKYAKSELLHLAVLPDFIARAPQQLVVAAPSPIAFQLKLQHDFQLGDTKPEISLTPAFQATIRANTTKGSNLFEDDPFKFPSLVPDNTGYVSVALQGSLDFGLGGSSGDVTFGIDATRTVSLEYWRAFTLGDGKTLGQATGETISGYVIPSALEDLENLKVNDICTVSGEGSLKISGGFKVTAAPNPLASLDLPLNTGKLEIKSGVMAGITASFSISGSYQIRARRTSATTIELGFHKREGATLTTDLSMSGGIEVEVGETDLLSSLLGAISDPNDDETKRLFAESGLSKDAIATLTGALKDSLDHSLQTSLDLALSQITDDEAVFQYEIRLEQLDEGAKTVLRQALKGDLSGLTALESGSAGNTLAPGIVLLSSVLTTMRKRETTLKFNLFGFVNYVSMSELIRKCTVVRDPDSGDLTIADSSTGNLINAETKPERRRQALHKAMFESLLLTTTYRVSNVVGMTGLTSSSFHFAFSDVANPATIADYLNWFAVMNLLTRQQIDDYIKQFVGVGPSTCLLRAEFDDQACESLFFQSPDQLWNREHYLDIGREAMRALINPNESDSNRFRYELLDQHWTDALQIGPNNNLGPLMGLQLTDPEQLNITQLLRSDVYTIDWWATAMQKAGIALLEMQKFIAGANVTAGADTPEFVDRRAQLQGAMADVIRNGHTQFDEPWGLVSMFWASGSRGASAKLVAGKLLVVKL